MRKRLILWSVVFTTVLTACAQTAQNVPSVFVGFSDPRAQFTFDDDKATGWDIFTNADQQALFWVNQGVLEGAVVADRGYIWSLNDQYYGDINVEASIQQSRGSQQGNGFGLMCRADETGDGYYFVISSSGQFAIMKGDLKQQNDLIPLVNWQGSRVIKQDMQANDLQAVCVKDYLAFYVNGQFLAETHDTTFTGGRIGVALVASGETAWVGFDNINVRDANIVD